MAWKGKVTAKSEDYTAGDVVVNVDYFDDGNPGTVLATKQFRFPAWYSLTELQLSVREHGARERRKRSQVDALAATFSVGVEVTV